jgi:hypothetical protein
MSAWTDEIEDAVRNLWISGKSATETAQIILARFGVKFSRSAIIGKVHRKSWDRERPFDVNEMNKAKVHQRGAERAARLGIAYVPPKRPRAPKGERKSVMTSAVPLRDSARIPGACARSDQWRPALAFGVTGKPERKGRAAQVLVDLSKAKTLADLGRRECKWPATGEGADTLFCAQPQAEASCYCLAHLRVGLSAEGFALYRKNRRRPQPSGVRVAEPLQSWAV